MKIYLEKPELAAVVFLLLLLVVFHIRSDGVFLGAQNLRGMLGLLPEMGLVAIGVTLLMICGEFDLSVGSVFALTPMTMAVLLAAGVPFAAGLRCGPRRRRADRLHQRLRHHPLRHTELHHHARHAVRCAVADGGDLRRLSAAAAGECPAEMAVHGLCRTGRAVPHVVLLVRR